MNYWETLFVALFGIVVGAAVIVWIEWRIKYGRK
jgi:hypothetical protein